MGKKYPYPINSWRNNWNNLAVFFRYPEQIRRVIYTTNAVENLHRQFRKVTKNRELFPNSLSRFLGNDALTKMLYLAYRDISKKWRMPIQNWAFIFSQFPIIFEDWYQPAIQPTPTSQKIISSITISSSSS